MGDVVDPRFFEKNSRAIMKSSKVWNNAVRSVVGPVMKVQKATDKDTAASKMQHSVSASSVLSSSSGKVPDLSRVSWSSFVQREPEKEVDSLAGQSQLPEQQSQSQVSLTRSLSSTSRRSAATSSRPNSALPFLLPPSDTEQLQFSDLTSPRKHLRAVSPTPSQISAEHRAAHDLVDIRGHRVPASLLSDGMIAAVRRQSDQLHREVLYSQTPKPPHPQAQSIANDTKPENQAVSDAQAQLQTQTAVMPLNELLSQPNNNESSFFSDSLPVISAQPLGQPSQTLSQTQTQSQSQSQHRRMISAREIETSATWKSLLSSTSRSKLSSLIRPEDDYALKWARMKAQRDATYQQQQQRLQHEGLRHLFQRVQQESERQSIDSAVREQRAARDTQLHRRQEEVNRLRQETSQLQSASQQRMHDKRKEARELRRQVASSLAAARALQEQERQEMRRQLRLEKEQRKEEHRQEDDSYSAQHGFLAKHSYQPAQSSQQVQLSRSWERGTLEELSSFSGTTNTHTQNSHSGHPDAQHLGEGDEDVRSTSSVVAVPEELTQRLRQATSLRAYQQAKHAIEQFTQTTLSRRYELQTHRRTQSLRRLQQRETQQISRTPVDASLFFSDSIFSLDSDTQNPRPNSQIPRPSSQIPRSQPSLSRTQSLPTPMTPAQTMTHTLIPSSPQMQVYVSQTPQTLWPPGSHAQTPVAAQNLGVVPLIPPHQHGRRVDARSYAHRPHFDDEPAATMMMTADEGVHGNSATSAYDSHHRQQFQQLQQHLRHTQHTHAHRPDA